MWLIFAFATAFLTSCNDVVTKKITERTSVVLYVWTMNVCAILLLLPGLHFVPRPSVGPDFWPAYLISGLVMGLVPLLYVKAIKVSDLSLVVPITAFTPIFLLVTSKLILGEIPSSIGMLGVVFIGVGSYILNLNAVRTDIWSPFKGLVSNKGARYMLLVAFLFSIGSNYSKMTLLNLSGSSYYWMLAMCTFTVTILTPFVLLRHLKKLPSLKSMWWMVILSAVIYLMSNISQMEAFKLTIVPYVIAVKRTSVVMSALWGFWIFKEKHIVQRLSGAVMMAGGVALIILFQ